MVDVFARSFVFFFKQKTAYEMRISDWSSDVCSSDLGGEALPERFLTVAAGNHDRHLAVHRAQFRCERIASAVRQADVDECGIDPVVGKTDLDKRFHRRYRLLDPKAQLFQAFDRIQDRKSTRMNSSHQCATRMTSST